MHRAALISGALTLVWVMGATAAEPPHRLLGSADAERRAEISISAGQATLVLDGAYAGALSLAGGLEPQSLTSLGSGWLVAGVRQAGRSPELALFVIERGSARELPLPPRLGEGRRESPVPLVGAGRLEGLVWLEGAARESYALRAARWDGARWSSAETISPTGRGSQLAPAARRTATGDWLVLWSAFDGTDDEILWTRHRGGRWSPPAPLHPGNVVPDITPALALGPRGPIAAWSQFDPAGYRLLSARFDGERWSAPRVIATAGALYPAFARAGARPLLLYLAAAPRRWVGVELDTSGRVLRRAELASTAIEPPVLDDRGAELVFRWGNGAARAAWQPGP